MFQDLPFSWLALTYAVCHNGVVCYRTRWNILQYLLSVNYLLKKHFAMRLLHSVLYCEYSVVITYYLLIREVRFFSNMSYSASKGFCVIGRPH